MWTYECTAVTLYAGFCIPFRNHNRSTTLLVCWSTCFKLTVCNILKCGYRKAVTIHKSDRIKEFVNHLNRCRTTCSVVFFLSILCICPVCRNIYQVKSVYSGINCLVVHQNNVITLLWVRLLSSFLHESNCFIYWHDVCKFEECWL